MKKIALFAVASIALVGCSQDVLVDNSGVNELSDKIEFGLSMADNATKASRVCYAAKGDGRRFGQCHS